jgi:hypothetical protein
MNNLVSLISGQFTRSLILGSFFPVVLFLMFGLLAIPPLLPNGEPLVEFLQQLETQWRILVVTFLAVALTVFLYYLNTPIIRFLEGYPWESSTFGRKRKDALQTRYKEMESLRPRLRLLRSSWSGIDANHPKVAEIQKHPNVLGRGLNFEYPSKPALILPTRFGNVLRSFETYSLRQYGIDAVVFWPRIVSVVDKETLSVVEDARSSVDFFVNCSILSALLAMATFALGGITITAATPWSTIVRWVLETSAAVLCAMLFYLQSINGVAAWGDQVKSVFDLFRWDLLKKMGYQQPPSSRVEERRLWEAVTKQVVYGDPPVATPVAYVPMRVRTSVKPDPDDTELRITSGVTKQAHGVLVYTYGITNDDTTRTAEIVLTETLPEGQVYLWGSARKNGGLCDVFGTNPFTINLGAVPPGRYVEVSYSAADIRK